VDLLYLDPPYNQHSYFSNYHIWETLVRNDRPAVYGKACKRVDCRSVKSLYNSRRSCFEALADVVRRARARYVLVSFSDEGFVGSRELAGLLSERGEVLRLDIPHKRYVGAQIGIYNPQGERVGKVSHLKNTEHLFLAGDRVGDLADTWDFSKTSPQAQGLALRS
jgi:adenine-specific DNA-methyltransferase